MGVELKMKRSIKNVVEDLTEAEKENERLKTLNKELRDRLIFLESHGSKPEEGNMTIFPNEKPIREFDLNGLKQGLSEGSYIKKLEDTVQYFSGKMKKLKKEFDSMKDENTRLLEEIHRKSTLAEKFKESFVKEKNKRKELEEKVKDAKVFVKSG